MNVKRYDRWILAIFLLGLGLGCVGCSTPEGGSSLPWAQPEPWEGTPVGIPMSNQQ
ncbi:MAG: hypothetical protein HYS07_01130 [Chlamydiae bacterium]|nr:hypothetical protein [Chlamydiota bacterium]MBI3276523.1 hypothetical protein [Chlamydiota bacterium]